MNMTTKPKSFEYIAIQHALDLIYSIEKTLNLLFLLNLSARMFSIFIQQKYCFNFRFSRGHSKTLSGS